MNRAATTLLVCAACGVAQPKFTAPIAGIVRDSHQQLRIVHAVSGTFILRDVVGATVADWAFDGNSGLVKTNAELLLIGANGGVVARRSAQQEAVLGPQSAFFPETHELWLAAANNVTKVPVEPAVIAGSVMALGPVSGRGVQLAVCRQDALWLLSVDTTHGQVTQELALGGTIGEHACIPSGGGSLVLLADRMLLATARALLVQTTAGLERKIPISATHVTRVGQHWVEAETPGGPAHMIQITSYGERAFQLPAAKELP